MEERMAAISLEISRLSTLPSSISTQPLQGVGRIPCQGLYPAGQGSWGEILPKAKAAVYKHLDLQVIWVTICCTMELFTLQMIHLLCKRLLQVPGDRV